MKRKCRYTPEELNIHDEAVKLRKMTDAQLVAAFKAAQKAATPSRMPQSGENDHIERKDTTAIEKLLQALSEGKCKGVGGGTCYKITEFAREMGLIA